jgi:hypothetical protein
MSSLLPPSMAYVYKKQFLYEGEKIERLCSVPKLSSPLCTLMPMIAFGPECSLMHFAPDGVFLAPFTTPGQDQPR